MGPKQDSIRRAQEYCKVRGLMIQDELGSGMNGVVFATERLAVDLFSPKQAAVKACHTEIEYVRERDVYLRLFECNVVSIRQCMVPQLVHYDDDLWIIEMTIVTRPFCLDFGGAFLEKPPDFSEEVMADWRAEKIEQFGKHWPEVERIIAVLAVHGIYLMDVHPKNISFLD